MTQDEIPKLLADLVICDSPEKCGQRCHIYIMMAASQKIASTAGHLLCMAASLAIDFADMESANRLLDRVSKLEDIADLSEVISGLRLKVNAMKNSMGQK